MMAGLNHKIVVLTVGHQKMIEDDHVLFNAGTHHFTREMDGHNAQSDLIKYDQCVWKRGASVSTIIYTTRISHHQTQHCGPSLVCDVNQVAWV